MVVRTLHALAVLGGEDSTPSQGWSCNSLKIAQRVLVPRNLLIAPVGLTFLEKSLKTLSGVGGAHQPLEIDAGKVG